MGEVRGGTTKLCHHLDPQTPVELYKVKLGKGFKLIGPVTDYNYHSSFRVQKSLSQPNIPDTTGSVGVRSSNINERLNYSRLQPATASYFANGSTSFAQFRAPITVKQESNSPPTSTTEPSVFPSDSNFLIPPTPAPSPGYGLNNSREGSRVLDEVFEGAYRPSVSSISSTSTSGLNTQSLQQGQQVFQQHTEQPLTTEDVTALQMNGILDHESIFRCFGDIQQLHTQQPTHQVAQPQQAQHLHQNLVGASPSRLQLQNEPTYCGVHNDEQPQFHENDENSVYTFGADLFYQQFLADTNEGQWPTNYGHH